FTISAINNAVEQIIKLSDKEWGGFGKAPKFPQSFIISFLLSYGHLQKNKDATDQALLALNKMYEGGIYDHVGGGFSRYSTDNEWLVPHFEKMLYDNALLVSVYAEAFQLTGNPVYKQVISESLDFVQRELTHSEGGFYSALDADSEGEEGKFYVWEYDELKDVLKAGFEEFSSFYDISPNGNWEGKNIIRLKTSVDELLKVIENDVFITERIYTAKNKLLEKRAKRIRPQLDDKILLGWNALMNKAYSKAFAATGNQHYKQSAIKNMDFLLSHFESGENEYYHTWKNGKGKQPAFLDDYGCLIEALIELQIITGNKFYLDKAKNITEFVVLNFSDTDSPFFFYTHKNQKDVLVRKKEMFDGATPSGNALMASNLYNLSIFFDNNEWKSRAEAMVKGLGEVSLRYPTSFGVWVSVIHELIAGSKEISIVGTEWENYLVELLKQHIPYKLIMCSEHSEEEYPMLREKGVTGQTIIYLCTNYKCSQPVNSVKRLISLLSVK
ncbi:MAG TPA: thioredoxin domain-containing protein, partial [Flavisolibacter sp.]|nr:thioredoxin domain-containing protein [Flavisolibacter sp.]